MQIGSRLFKLRKKKQPESNRVILSSDSRVGFPTDSPALGKGLDFLAGAIHKQTLDLFEILVTSLFPSFSN